MVKERRKRKKTDFTILSENGKDKSINQVKRIQNTKYEILSLYRSSHDCEVNT